MTGGGQSSWIMRPHCFWNSLQPAILAVLCLTLKADNKHPGCVSEIKVGRHTTYDGVIGQELKITCPVTFCKRSPPKVSWVKSEGAGFHNVSTNAHIRTEWKDSDQSEGTYYLIFQSILRKDAGVYRCEVNGSVGHIINVSVHDDIGQTNSSQKNNTNEKGNPSSEIREDVMIYVYSAAGIALLVIIVISISIISMTGCKGNSKKEALTENQYMSMPMDELRATPQRSPRGSPCVPPSRRSTKRQTPLRESIELTSSRDNMALFNETEEEGRGQRHTVSVEESSSVVYAALNHDVTQRPAARPRAPEEETSEYAAIRVK
ncbi:uncharacterized protein btla isoform 3-T3 [Menidia menidia]